MFVLRSSPAYLIWSDWSPLKTVAKFHTVQLHNCNFYCLSNFRRTKRSFCSVYQEIRKCLFRFLLNDDSKQSDKDSLDFLNKWATARRIRKSAQQKQKKRRPKKQQSCGKWETRGFGFGLGPHSANTDDHLPIRSSKVPPLMVQIALMKRSKVTRPFLEFSICRIMCFKIGFLPSSGCSLAYMWIKLALSVSRQPNRVYGTAEEHRLLNKHSSGIKQTHLVGILQSFDVLHSHSALFWKPL